MNKDELEAIIRRLEAGADENDKQLENAEDEDKIDRLNTIRDSYEDAISYLNDLKDTLENQA